MALRKARQSCNPVGVENHEALKRTRQSSAFPLTSQRRALNEIGNVVSQSSARDTTAEQTSKGNPKTTQKPQLRRSTRLSLAVQPSRVTVKPKEAPIAEGRTEPRKKVQAMGPPRPAAPSVAKCAETSSGPTKRKSVAPSVVTRAPRLTMKPPPVETPPEERLAAQKLVRQSLAADRSRRFTLALAAQMQPVPLDLKHAPDVGNTQANDEKQEKPDILGKDDIDLSHNRCFWMVTTYSKHIYAYLHRLDWKMASKERHDQLKSVKETTRTKLVEWMASAYHQLHLLQETFQLSVSILDRYLQRVTDIKETKLELVAVTCLSIGIKYEELLTSLVQELLSLSSRPYTMKEFIEMEANVISGLDFQVARPIPLVFLRRYNTAAKCDRTQHGYGKYLIDLAQLDMKLARLPASSLASAASFIGISLKTLQVDPQAWTPVMVHYTTLTFNDIKPLVSRMAGLLLPGGPQCRSLRRKYAAEASYLSTERVQCLLQGLQEITYS